MKLIRLLANLGYGSRREVTRMLKNGWVTRRDGTAFGPDDDVTDADYADILIDDEPMDPPQGLILMLHKPLGYTCSTKDVGRLVYELLPPRFRERSPVISTVGRLDRDTSGLLLMTDDGPLLHRIIAPKARIPKIYEVDLAADLRGDEGELFASGTLVLESETEPLAPATMEVVNPRKVRLTLIEGRYHQVRRMFAATGNHVERLHRSEVGGLKLDDLAEGQWKLLGEADVERLFSGS